MNHYFYSNESEINPEKDIEIFNIDETDLKDDSIYNTITSVISDDIYHCLFTTHLSDKSLGFFPDIDSIWNELYKQAIIKLEEKFGKILYFKVVDESNNIVSCKQIETYKIMEDRMYEEQGTVDTGQVILIMFNNFLKKGKWQYGLKREDGTILSHISQFPKPIKYDKGYIWQDSIGILEPIIWFGMDNENPIDCWTIDRSSKRFEIVSEYEDRETKEKYKVERWKDFWFMYLPSLDWNTLFDNKGDDYIIWMFIECGMDEPTKEFIDVRDSCLITLDENDKSENVIRKMEKFFISKQT